jgi:NAD(P)-dependent dehydrogenase (short-subunit alcohol dehydrogenase family)
VPFINRRRFLQATAAFAFAPHFAERAQYAQAVPRSAFGAASTAEEVTAGIDFTGKTALVTGCNSGIGYETMRVLALRGAHVLGTARTEERGAEACESVAGRCTPLALELTDFDSIAACADRVAAMNVPVDMLICNAGVLFRELRQVDGLEMQFVVNHLGHFILVNRLLSAVLAAAQGRVVVVGSTAHRNPPDGGIQFDDLSGHGWARSAYAHSKLANGLFSLELARQLADTNASSNSLHPGLVDTNIFRNVDTRISSGRSKTVEEGAATTCYVATSPALAAVSGYYFADCNPEEPSAMMQDSEMAARLWAVSEELTAGYLG